MSLGPLDSPTDDRPAMSYADVCAELGTRPPSISMVVPALNEAENLVETIPQAIAVLKGMHSDYEVLVVDDGSTDGTPEVMRQLCAEYPQLKSIRLRRNAGKAAALSIGFDLAKNDVLVMMDADGQDEPREIPALVAKLDEGFDLVTGRRSDTTGSIPEATHLPALQRYDRMGERSARSGFQQRSESSSPRGCRDRRSLRRAPPLLPVLAAWSGFSVTEVEVEHHLRLHGKTKYGIARFWRGLFDLVHRQVHHLLQPSALPPFRRGRIPVGIDRSGPADLDVHPTCDGPTGRESSCVHHRCPLRGGGCSAPVFGLLGELLVYLFTTRGGSSPLPAAEVIQEEPDPRTRNSSPLTESPPLGSTNAW